jgi:membrane protein involved in colicin uptake
MPESPPVAVVSAPMTRRSLRPQLNQIRTWVRQGRTDAWIAHQLEVTVQQIEAFKREQALEVDGDDANGFAEEVDLRAEDDAAIAAELEAEERRRAEQAAREAEEAARRAEEEASRAEEAARLALEAGHAEGADDGDEGDESSPESDDEDGDEAARPRRRRRGGRSRRRSNNAKTLEGTFDHGEEGYGLWLDPAVADNAVYAEHWAGHRPVEVTIDEDQIVIRRAGSADSD